MAVAVSALLAAVGGGMAGHGGRVGDAVGDRLWSAVRAEGRPGGATGPVPATTRTGTGVGGGPRIAPPPPEVLARQVGDLLTGRRRTWTERQGSVGPDRVHVPRDQLRLTPVVAPHAVWSDTWSTSRTGHGAAGAVDATACALCASLGWSHDLAVGTSVDRDGPVTGVQGELVGGGQLALASVQAGARVAGERGPVSAGAQGRVRGTVGAEFEARLHAVLGHDAQDVEVRGSAMAGASAKAEGTAGLHLLGVAVTQSAEGEAWAGAGAKGVAGFHHAGTKVAWRLGLGGAWGFGAATEWSGSVDVAGVPAQHRRLARDALFTAAHITMFVPH
ncbi:MAG: hypothetical protein JWM98_2858 [Thermoleophilia bacterium]|nr:hypothetical protein [Thermoleophilia bacterium]